jgi:serine/threonine-protein kinase
MGEVWAAEHDMLARPAAVKLVRPELMRRSRLSSDAMSRFEREAQSTAGLSSPHTVNLYDFGVTDEDVFYYVMELLDGLDLEVLVRRHGPVPPGRAVHFLVQACDSLAEAHANGLVHRDIKPSNLFACRQGLTHDFIKVLDFGIVNPQGGSPSDAGAEGITPVEGTPGWIAPEAAEHGTSDARADLYALGCVGYWLLTGRLVFEAEEAVGVIRMHREDAPVRPSRHANAVPPELDAVILACLAKDPDRRPSSAVELATMLRAAAVTPWSDAEAIGWWRSVNAGSGDRAVSEG